MFKNDMQHIIIRSIESVMKMSYNTPIMYYMYTILIQAYSIQYNIVHCG